MSGQPTASTTDDSLSRLQELEVLNARLVVERDAAERALEELAEAARAVLDDSGAAGPWVDLDAALARAAR